MSFLASFRTLAARRSRAAGDAARDSRDWQQAAIRYKAYLQAVPDDAAIWVQLGHAHKEMGNLDLAERSYCRALSIEPGNPDTHVQMGHIEKLKGNREQSLARYRKALEIDPDFAAALVEFDTLESAFLETGPSAGKKRRADESTIAQQFDDLWERLEHLEDREQPERGLASEVQRIQERIDKIDKRVEKLVAQLGQAIASTTTPLR